MALLQGKVVDYAFARVCAARATNLMKFEVQQLVQTSTAAANARVMKLDFDGLEF
jgi:hypothetical protein